jgi:hypothetical protein
VRGRPHPDPDPRLSLQSVALGAQPGRCHIVRMPAYRAVEIPGPLPRAWTLVETSSGRDMRDVYKFTSQRQAQEIADLMNSQPTEEAI